MALNKSMQGHPVVVVDVEKYKERRSKSLEALASRVAERVARSGRPITLEPMPASERRVIHLALSNHSSVTTESVGEGQQRKVTVNDAPERLAVSRLLQEPARVAFTV